MTDKTEPPIADAHERIMGLALFFASLYLIYLSLDFPFDSRVFPMAVLGLMAVLSASLVIRSFTKQPALETARTFFVHKPRFLMTFGSVLGYIALLPTLGYFTTSTLFFVILTRLLGYRNKKGVILTTGIFLGIVYLVFVWLFERPIPPEFFLRH